MGHYSTYYETHKGLSLSALFYLYCTGLSISMNEPETSRNPQEKRGKAPSMPANYRVNVSKKGRPKMAYKDNDISNVSLPAAAAANGLMVSPNQL